MQLGSSCVCLHCAAAESSFTKLQISHSNAGQLGEHHTNTSQAMHQALCSYTELRCLLRRAPLSVAIRTLYIFKRVTNPAIKAINRGGVVAAVKA